MQTETQATQSSSPSQHLPASQLDLQTIRSEAFSPCRSQQSGIWTDSQVLDKCYSSTAESPVILTYQALKGFLNIQPSLTWTTLEFCFKKKKSKFYSFFFSFVLRVGALMKIQTKIHLVKAMVFPVVM